MNSTIPPTLATVLTLWASQVVRQAYVDGLPAFTETLYGWQPGAVGILLTIWGFSTLPVNWAVGALSSRVRPPPPPPSPAPPLPNPSLSPELWELIPPG